MNRLAKIIQGLGEREIDLIQKDLDAGNIERLIAQRRKQLSIPRETNCPVCGQEVGTQEHLSLEFGPSDLRQRAVFDGPDCLSYFVEERLRKHEQKR